MNTGKKLIKAGKCITAVLLALTLSLSPYRGMQQADAAGKVTVYVLKKINYFKDKVHYSKTSVDYTKTGLVKGVLTKGMLEGSVVHDTGYSYDAKHRIKEKAESGRYLGIQTSRYYYQGKHLKKIKSKRVNPANEKSTETRTFFYDRKNRVKQIKVVNGDQVSVERYQYDKKSRVKLHIFNYFDGSSREKYTYDSKGYLKTMGQIRYKNAYKNGRLVKRWEGTDNTPNKYTYQKISVSKSDLAQIKKQQWSLLNADLNLALH